MVNALFDKLRHLGQLRDSTGLHALIAIATEKQLLDAVEETLEHDNFLLYWNYLLQAFDDTDPSKNKRFAVINKTLKLLARSSVNNSKLNEIVKRLLRDFNKLSATQIVAFGKYCLDNINKGKFDCPIWRDMLPVVIHVALLRDKLDYYGEEISGSEYREKLITSLCNLEWTANVAVPLATMFTNLVLAKLEHQKVVTKLCLLIEALQPHELPAFVFQMLLLCSKDNSKLLFFKLQQYFDTRIYKDYEQDTNDILDNAAINRETIEAESTVLFYIHKWASSDAVRMSEFLSALRIFCRTPEIVLRPFQLAMLLTLSYNDNVMEIIRTAITRSHVEYARIDKSAWLRAMVLDVPNVDNLFKKVINYSSQNRDSILKGLVDLSIIFLGVSPALGRDDLAEHQWTLGCDIMASLIRANRYMATTVLNLLTDNIIASANVGPFIDCLHVIARKFTVSLLGKKSVNRIKDLLQSLQHLNFDNGRKLIIALMPLIRESHDLKTTLLQDLLKALYSGSTDARLIAVTGYLQLLRNLKVSSMMPTNQLSQSSSILSCSLSMSLSSGSRSVLTQMSMSSGVSTQDRVARNVFSNEEICWEILRILRRCLMQQVEVKNVLYDGLIDIVRYNNHLALPIMECLLVHFEDFYVIESDTLPPLVFDRLTKQQNGNIVLTESLGKCIFAISLSISKLKEIGDEAMISTVKFETILDSLCDRMPKCDLHHLGLDERTFVNDDSLEAQGNVLIVREILQVYEALIGYKVCTWESTSRNSAIAILALFKKYFDLLQFSKEATKSKKGSKKDKSNESVMKDVAKNVMKTPDSLFDLKTLEKILSLLIATNVDWANKKEIDSLKSNVEMHQFFLGALHNVLNRSTKRQKTTELHETKASIRCYTNISVLLYRRCILRYDNYSNFDQKSAVLALECFHLILNHICRHYKDEIERFLMAVGKLSSEVSLEMCVKSFIETYTKMLVNTDDESDADTNRMLVCVMNTLALLSDQYPTKATTLSNQFLSWLHTFLSETVIFNKNVANTFIGLLFTTELRFRSCLKIFTKCCSSLSSLYGPLSDELSQASEDVKFINEANSDAVFSVILTNIKNVMNDIEWALSRCKSEFYMCSFVVDGSTKERLEILGQKERSICSQMFNLAEMLVIIANTKIPVGSLNDNVLKIFELFYNKLSALTKYFASRCSKTHPSDAIINARFNNVIKKVGKHLSSVIYDYFVHMDSSAENRAAPKKRAALKTKIARDTRLIPQVIFEMEQFSKAVSQISVKSKIDLSKYVGIGVTRDFRIKTDAIKRLLADNIESANSQDSSNDSRLSVESSGSSLPSQAKKVKSSKA